VAPDIPAHLFFQPASRRLGNLCLARYHACHSGQLLDNNDQLTKQASEWQELMMNKTNSKRLSATLLLLFGIGTGTFALGYWYISYPQAIPISGVIAAVSLGISVILYIWAFLLILKWRDERWRDTNAVKTNAAQPPALSQQNLEGTIYGLTTECQYQVVKSFIDYYDNSFKQGDILRFRERHFLPYHGGHTIIFDEQSLYLQEEINKEILDNFSAYIIKVT